METGEIDVASLSGGLDLYRTLESGQSYCWRRSDGRMYADTVPDPDVWYETVLPARDPATSDRRPHVLRVRQHDGRLAWQSTTDAEPAVRRLLRLDDDLERIVEASPDDALIRDAYETHCGMRLVGDPPFATLIAFICSAQMRVSRIHGMARRLAATYGTELTFDPRGLPTGNDPVSIHAFPTPEQLAAASEDDLRDLSLGYRAPYVVATAAMVADGEAHPEAARDLPYEEAREYLTQFVGVGEKVADCVALFALDFDEAVPLDTWIRRAIAQHYPDCDRGTYAETSRAIRERFGGTYAGYVQAYVFHHLRTDGG